MPEHAARALDSPEGAPKGRPLIRRIWYPTLAYSLLVVYASLYPLTGWYDSGTPPLGFMVADWPRYTTAFDICSNVAAYLPLGMLWLTALRRRWPVTVAWPLALLVGGALSFGVEAMQNYLPSRVPSNLDLACNVAGTALGILAGWRWGRLLRAERWRHWREVALVPGDGVDLGVLLLGGWLLTQLSPETLLFGSGNLRGMLDLPPAQPFLADGFVRVEASIAATGLLAAGLMASLLLKRAPRWRVLAGGFGLIATAMLLKTLSYALLMEPSQALVWVTPGNGLGIIVGFVLWAAATQWSAVAQRAVAALALLLATVMVNIAPENPYLANTLDIWNPGHFLNFNGLTRLVCWLWPFLALTWLMVYPNPNAPLAHHDDPR